MSIKEDELADYVDGIDPQHYNKWKIEPITFIMQNQLDFCEGNVIKYVCRAGHKKGTETDLEKAIVYLQNELTNVKRQNLSRHNSQDSIVFTGSGIQGGVSDSEYSNLDSPFNAEGFNSGGVQGIFGSGGDVISFGDSIQSTLP